MSAMGESKFLQANSGRNRSNHSPQDLAPYSAVSSFNLPTFCDSTLVTPVFMIKSPSMTAKSAQVLKSDTNIKLSPSSPSYHFLASDDEYNNERYESNPPMKYKHPNGTMHMSAADSSFPISPYCPEPFWGSYRVSATPVPGRSESSPSGNPSPPQIHSAGGLSNSSSPYGRQHPSLQKASSYNHQQAPILLVPSPSILRPLTNPSRQNSLQSTSTTPGSATGAQRLFPEPLRSLPPRGKKRKFPSKDARDKGIILAEEKTEEEELLLDLSHVQRLPWKDVQQKYMEKFPQPKVVKVATLQMRKKRLIDRLRVWTDEDERALTLAVEKFDKNRWETISDNMMKHGCAAKWPKEMCQRKWQELHPEDGPWLPQYEMAIHYQDPGGWGPDEGQFSEGPASASHSVHEGDSGVLTSAVSTATAEEVRSRTMSDASSQMLHSRSQNHQQQLVYDELHHNGWGPEA